MRFNPPPLMVVLIALVLALLAIITKLGLGVMPHFFPHQDFWLALSAYLVLMTGNLMKGI